MISAIERVFVSETATLLSPTLLMPPNSTLRVLLLLGSILLVSFTLLGAVTVSLRLLAQVPLTDTSPDSPGASVAGTVTV